MKSYSNSVAPQSTHCICSGDSEPGYSLGHSPNPRSLTGLQPYVAMVCRLVFSMPVIHVNIRITTHLLTQERWKAEMAYFGWPIVDNLLTKWLPVNVDWGQGRESLPAKDQCSNHLSCATNTVVIIFFLLFIARPTTSWRSQALQS